MEAREKLAWFLFLKMGTVPLGELTPPVIAEFIQEFRAITEPDMDKLLKAEFRTEDLPECLKGEV